MEVTPEFLTDQIDSVFEDIVPQATKIGMVSSGLLIQAIGEGLRRHGAENLVVDPVMVATSGAKLISDDAVDTLCRVLLPMARVITPNVPEGEILAEMEIRDSQDMELAAKKIFDAYGCAVLLKGGHRVNDANDYLYTGEGGKWFYGDRIDNPNTHGTGCTLSSAIASQLAKGKGLEEAVTLAKAYISEALRAMLDLGQGSGPLDHGFMIEDGKYEEN